MLANVLRDTEPPMLVRLLLLFMSTTCVPLPVLLPKWPNSSSNWDNFSVSWTWVNSHGFLALLSIATEMHAPLSLNQSAYIESITKCLNLEAAHPLQRRWIPISCSPKNFA